MSITPIPGAPKSLIPTPPRAAQAPQADPVAPQAAFAADQRVGGPAADWAAPQDAQDAVAIAAAEMLRGVWATGSNRHLMQILLELDDVACVREEAGGRLVLTSHRRTDHAIGAAPDLAERVRLAGEADQD